MRASGSLNGSLPDFEAAIFCKAKPCAVHFVRSWVNHCFTMFLEALSLETYVFTSFDISLADYGIFMD